MEEPHQSREQPHSPAYRGFEQAQHGHPLGSSGPGPATPQPDAGPRARQEAADVHPLGRALPTVGPDGLLLTPVGQTLRICHGWKPGKHSIAAPVAAADPGAAALMTQPSFVTISVGCTACSCRVAQGLGLGLCPRLLLILNGQMGLEQQLEHHRYSGPQPLMRDSPCVINVGDAVVYPADRPQATHHRPCAKLRLHPHGLLSTLDRCSPQCASALPQRVPRCGMRPRRSTLNPKP